MVSEPKIELIGVSYDELQTAIAIWITTAPKRMWRDYWAHSETVGKWAPGGTLQRFDPRHALAEYLVGRFRQCNWQVSHPPTENIFEGIGTGGRKPQ